MKVALGVVALCCVLSSACSDTAVQDPAEVAQPEKFRAASSLDCLDEQRSVGVFDGPADASGEASPEAAAQRAVAEERLGRDDSLTQRTTSDATGTLYVDYVSADGRLVMYVTPRQQPDGTWVVEQVAACSR